MKSFRLVSGLDPVKKSKKRFFLQSTNRRSRSPNSVPSGDAMHGIRIPFPSMGLREWTRPRIM